MLVIFVITFGTISPVGTARFASTESVVSSSMTSGESSKSSASWLCEDALSFFCSTGDEDANFAPSLRTDSARPSFLDKSNGCSYIVWLAGLEANGTRGGIFDSRRSLAREFWNQTWTWNNNLFKNTLWIFHNYKVYEFLFPLRQLFFLLCRWYRYKFSSKKRQENTNSKQYIRVMLSLHDKLLYTCDKNLHDTFIELNESKRYFTKIDLNGLRMNKENKK